MEKRPISEMPIESVANLLRDRINEGLKKRRAQCKSGAETKSRAAGVLESEAVKARHEAELDCYSNRSVFSFREGSFLPEVDVLTALGKIAVRFGRNSICGTAREKAGSKRKLAGAMNKEAQESAKACEEIPQFVLFGSSE